MICFQRHFRKSAHKPNSLINAARRCGHPPDIKPGVTNMKTIIALVTALSFAAPIAASAATMQNQNNQLVQKIESTYHTSFPTSQN